MVRAAANQRRGFFPDSDQLRIFVRLVHRSPASLPPERRAPEFTP